jgi:hypothetical protein
MSQNKPDPLLTGVQELQRTLAANSGAHDAQWGNSVHLALGRLAAGIQEEVQSAEKAMETVGEINPDFQNTPTSERHIRTKRADLIKLGEQVHQLRAEIRADAPGNGLGPAQLVERGQAICAEIEKVRHTENEFMLTTLNVNPGGGD